METLIAYNGDKKLKASLLKEITKHRKADQIIQGTYGEGKGDNWKGCAVACSVRSLAIAKGEKLGERYADHERYETDLGIPRILARLEDRIFEGLPKEDALDFPHAFASAIRPGADLSLVWPKFAVWLLADKTNGVIRHAKTAAQRKAINDVANLYKRVIKGKVIEVNTWLEARRAADAADAAAADAADADAARKTHYKKMAKKLISLLKAV
jgi:hypothetical protein